MAELPLADSAENGQKFKLFSLAKFFSLPNQGVQKLTGDSLKLVWAEFSTIS